MTDYSLENAVKIVNSLREEIATLIIEYDNNQIAITMTFGINEYNDQHSPEACIEAAESALYQGKRMGKNRVEVSTHTD